MALLSAFSFASTWALTLINLFLIKLFGPDPPTWRVNQTLVDRQSNLSWPQLRLNHRSTDRSTDRRSNYWRLPFLENNFIIINRDLTIASIRACLFLARLYKNNHKPGANRNANSPFDGFQKCSYFSR